MYVFIIHYFFTALNVKDLNSVVSWCIENKITFVIVGPEDPLAAGIVDNLTEKGNFTCFKLLIVVILIVLIYWLLLLFYFNCLI